MNPEYKVKLERIKETITKEMAQVLTHYYDQPIDQEGGLLRQIEADLRSRLSGVITAEGFDDRSEIKFRVEQGKTDINRLMIYPDNLFTALLFHGIYVPPAVLGHKESWVTEHGTYIHRNGHTYFQPAQTADYITFNITPEKDD